MPLPGRSENVGWHFLGREKDRGGGKKDGEKMKILKPNSIVVEGLVSQMGRGNEPPG